MGALLLATGNAGKIPGLLAGLGEIPFTIVSLNDVTLPDSFIVEETGSTYESNALIKAFMYGKHAGLLTLADDSGLEVDALGGEPGVHTAHYFSGTRDERIQQLLDKLAGMPMEKRTARYRCVIALYDPKNDKVRFAEGASEGKIALEPHGTHGFGYDPVFLSDDLGKTFGDSSLEDVTGVSHRGRALVKAREILKTEYAG
jgi:XTP/dITP diphosphohydrolase